MQNADDIRKTILKVAEECGPGKSFMPADVARMIDRDNWTGLVQTVSFVAEVMHREGKIQLSLSNGQVQYRKTS